LDLKKKRESEPLGSPVARIQMKHKEKLKDELMLLMTKNNFELYKDSVLDKNKKPLQNTFKNRIEGEMNYLQRTGLNGLQYL
jgi:hypothetical protein